MKEWHFEEKVFRRWVVLMICTREELVGELRRIKYEWADEMPLAAGFNIRLTPENSDGYSCTLVWMPKFSAATLAHEIVHLVMHTFDRAGVPISIDNEETFAFYNEYWIAEMSRVYRRYPNGRSATEAKK